MTDGGGVVPHAPRVMVPVNPRYVIALLGVLLAGGGWTAHNDSMSNETAKRMGEMRDHAEDQLQTCQGKYDLLLQHVAEHGGLK